MMPQQGWVGNHQHPYVLLLMAPHILEVVVQRKGQLHAKCSLRVVPAAVEAKDLAVKLLLYPTTNPTYP
jgi:hypothetical protein